MGFNIYGNEQVAVSSAVYAGFALSWKTYGLAVVNSLGNGNLVFLIFLNKACSSAWRAGVFDSLTCSVAGWTCSCCLHCSKNRLLNNSFLSCTVTFTAGLRMGTGLCACSVAGITGISNIYLNILLTAEYRFFKGDLYRNIYITSAHGAVSSCRAASAKAKHTEYIA